MLVMTIARIHMLAPFYSETLLMIRYTRRTLLMTRYTRRTQRFAVYGRRSRAARGRGCGAAASVHVCRAHLFVLRTSYSVLREGA